MCSPFQVLDSDATLWPVPEKAADLREILAVMGWEVELAAAYDMRDKPRSWNGLVNKSVSGTVFSLLL